MTHLIALLAVPFASRSLAERMTLTVHIAAGTVAIIVGFVTLAATKGSPTHRRLGLLFVYTMLIMSLLGAATAAVWDRVAFINVPAGLLTAYLVITALTTVRDSFTGSRQLTIGLMLVALILGSTDLFFGVKAVMAPDGRAFGFPPFPFFMFAGVALLGVIGDARMLRSGPLVGAPRIARHLWRMTYGLFIAALSFFLGQAKVIPKPIRSLPLLAIPPLVVLGSLLYWLWRVRFRRSLKGLVLRGSESSQAAAPDTTRTVKLRQVVTPGSVGILPR